MTPLPELSELRRKRRTIQDQLAALGDLRPGSLTPRYRKCGKPTCHCAAQGDPVHGPSWSLTWAVEGKTRTRIIPAEAVEETQTQIAEYRRARTLTRELFEVSPSWHFFGLTGPDRGMFSASKHNILGSVMA